MGTPVNLVFHITLPQGMALVSGAYLGSAITFDVISGLTPYYASVDQVRLAGGMYIRKLSDLALACQVYTASQKANLLNETPPQYSIGNPNATRFVGSRNMWVVATAARDMILNVIGLIGMPSTHTLANFSVTKERANENEGVGARLAELNNQIAMFEVTLRSGGWVVPGGRPKALFAAKGVFDWTERTPARTWFSTGMGANATSQDFGSPTGGRGKPTKFFSSPFYSPPIINLRTGIYQGAYPLVTVYPYPNNSP